MPPDPEQISKKELLELTGISYGQLYRWKRKGLIPEAWFVKKAAFTGQETFFPRAEVLERVARIQGMKDDLNLDELAGLFSPSPARLRLPVDQWAARGLVSRTALDLLAETLAPADPLAFHLALSARIVDLLMEQGGLTREEGAGVLRTLAAGDPVGQGQLLFLRHKGVGFCLLAQGQVAPDPEARLVARIDLAAQVTELKLKLGV